MYSRLEAKMTGITPAWLTFIGMYVEVPPYIRRPTIRLAYCTGMRRCACSMNTMPVKTTTTTATDSTEVNGPLVWKMVNISPGMTAMTCVKIRIDMPLPTPRSVISSPIHMMTAVPATMVITIVAIRNTEASGMIGLSVAVHWLELNSVPLRASSMYPVDCKTARPMVRYLVYWVIFAWPAWPSCLRASSRGITTVSSCKMMLAVMYGIMPRANTDMYFNALPLSRSTIA